MNNIYKVTLLYSYGDARPEPGVTLFIACDHIPSMEELENSEIVQWELSRHDCDYIDPPELASEDEVKRCRANIFSLTDKRSDRVEFARDIALKHLNYILSSKEYDGYVEVTGSEAAHIVVVKVYDSGDMIKTVL